MARSERRLDSGEIRRRAVLGARVAVQRIADDVLARAVARTPMEEGTLRASGEAGHDSAVDNSDEYRQEVSFNTPYAAAQHEGGWVTGPLAGVRIKHWTTPGTGPKFLESALKEELPRYREIVGLAVRASIEGRLPG